MSGRPALVPKDTSGPTRPCPQRSEFRSLMSKTLSSRVRGLSGCDPFRRNANAILREFSCHKSKSRARDILSMILQPFHSTLSSRRCRAGPPLSPKKRRSRPVLVPKEISWPARRAKCLAALPRPALLPQEVPGLPSQSRRYCGASPVTSCSSKKCRGGPSWPSKRCRGQSPASCLGEVLMQVLRRATPPYSSFLLLKEMSARSLVQVLLLKEMSESVSGQLP